MIRVLAVALIFAIISIIVNIPIVSFFCGVMGTGIMIYLLQNMDSNIDEDDWFEKYMNDDED